MAEDMNTLVGRMWSTLAAWQCDLSVQRVESKANIADGPTRGSFKEVAEVGAMFCRPKWPAWASNVWTN